MLMSLSRDVMTSGLDDIDKKIISALRKNNEEDYASLQRKTDTGSSRTIKKHVAYLEKQGLVKDEIVPKGSREFHKVTLTKKGRSVK